MAVTLKRRLELVAQLIPAQKPGGYDPQWDDYRCSQQYRIKENMQQYLPMIQHGYTCGISRICENGHTMYTKMEHIPVYPGTPEMALLNEVMYNPAYFKVENQIDRRDLDVHTLLGMAKMGNPEPVLVRKITPYGIIPKRLVEGLIFGEIYPGIIHDMTPFEFNGSVSDLGFHGVSVWDVIRIMIPGRLTLPFDAIGVRHPKDCQFCGGRAYHRIAHIPQGNLYGLIAEIKMNILRNMNLPEDDSEIEVEKIDALYDEIQSLARNRVWMKRREGVLKTLETLTT